MNILFVDTETTGLDPLKDRMTEIAAALWNADSKRIVRVGSFITNDDTIKTTAEIIEVNKIDQFVIDKFGTDFGSVFKLLTDNFYAHAAYLCAHNAPFDKAFINEELKRVGQPMWDKPFIDTSVDLPFPPAIKTRKLTHLAAEHNFLNPFPHIALADVLTTIRLFESYPIADVIEKSRSPSVKLKAFVTYETRELASSRGYRWDSPNKIWWKNIKEIELDAEIKNCKAAGFTVARCP